MVNSFYSVILNGFDCLRSKGYGFYKIVRVVLRGWNLIICPLYLISPLVLDCIDCLLKLKKNVAFATGLTKIEAILNICFFVFFLL